MIRSSALVRSVGLDPAGRSTVRISCDPSVVPAAGQAMLALPSEDPATIRFTLYPVEVTAEGFRCLMPAGQRWLPGDQLNLLGPIGRGFAPPAGSRRRLLVAAAGSAWPLRPLIRASLEAGADVALSCPAPAPDLAADVELLASPVEALGWADYLAVDLGPYSPGELRSTIGLERPFDPPCPTEVLLSRDLVCGFGGCLGCGLATADGWGLICQRGPVFPWDELRA